MFVRDIGAIVAGIALGLAWLALWNYLLRALSMPLLSRKGEDRAVRQEHLKRMGKLKCILLYGVLGFGFAFGLAMTVADYIGSDSFHWIFELLKLVFLAVAFGLFQGMQTWDDVRGPVPFPPNYPPQK